jgi:hypothetical protein
MNDPMQEMTAGGAGEGAGGDVLGKIEALKAQIEGITVALDDIAASVGGEAMPEAVPGGSIEEPTGLPAEAEATPSPFKKKPKGDLVKGLGI